MPLQYSEGAAEYKRKYHQRTYESRATAVVCEHCGKRVDRRGYAGHLRSKMCIAARENRQASGGSNFPLAEQHVVEGRHAAGSGRGSAGAGGTEEQGSGSAGTPAAAAGAAGSDTDMENEQEVRRSESSSTAAAAKSISTMAAPTSEDDRSVEPDGGDSSGGSGSGERGRRRGCTERLSLIHISEPTRPY